MAGTLGGPLLVDKLVGRFGRPRTAEKLAPEYAATDDHRDSGLPWRRAFRNPANYLVGESLDRAAYVSLLLGQPLLLTGEPGAGKSDFARKLAHIFNLGDVQEIHVKTTTSGRDLLYNFDDIGRFRDATAKSGTKKGARPLCEYVRFNALGRAILRSAGPDAKVRPLGRDMDEIYRGEITPDPDGRIPLASLFPPEFGRVKGQDPDAVITTSLRTVVLIDEIDKAQRDTPNDLLDEIERMRFDIPELSITIQASSAYWPIVVITSNAERVLPAPFLRRCIFHRLITPEEEEVLKKIIAARMTEDFSDGPLADDVLTIFLALRKNPGQRPPGLSELLSWCLLLKRLEFDSFKSLPKSGELISLLEASLAALSKTELDFEAAKHVFAQWKAGQLTKSGDRQP
jgi:MoxR-like ATPase